MPFVGIGVGIGRQRFASGIFAAYAARVAADGGVTEAGACVDAVSGISLDASLLLVPSGYKSGVVYSEIPTNGDGDLTFTRASDATRVNSDGEIEVVGSGVPRLDYSQGSCPALLLEPQRTNLCLQSEDFTTGWALEGATISSNTTTAPDGNTTADRFSETAITDVHRIYRSAFVITSGTIYTYSLFVLKGTSRYCRLVFNQSSNSSIWAAAQFDLDTLTFTSGVGSGGGTFSGATISQLPNSSWIRITISASLATTSAFAFFTLSNGTAISSSDSRGCHSYLGSTSNNLIIWGADFEQGAYATTYIPTTTATVTRLADAASKTGISSLIGQTEGVIYWEGVVLNQTDILAINRSTVNGIYITKGSGNLYRAAIYNSSSVIQFADVGVKTTTTKIAIAYKSGDSALFVNGSKIGATNTSTINFSGALSELRLNDNYLIANAPQFTNKINIYNTRLSDSDCITLTT